MVSALFDDHYYSFCTWREAGLSDLTCVHVDAHLDVMRDGFTEQSLKGIAQARNREELETHRGNPRLPWGGFHCGNYLYPALRDGTVTELIWVIPAHVVAGESFVDGVRQEVQNWLDLTLDEYAGLKGEGGAVVGSLEGVRFVVCTADTMPVIAPGRSVALDIDVDYFIRNTDDLVWQNPYQLKEQLGRLDPVCLTVAYSVDGGYTPLRERFLGQVVLDAFSSDQPVWREMVEQLLKTDQGPKSSREAEWENLLAIAPEWLKPSLLLRLGRAADAQELDPEYTPRIANVVARFLVKKQHELGLQAMSSLREDSSEAHYLRTYLSLGKGDAVAAKQSLSRLLQDDSLIHLERSKVLALKANACLDLGEGKEALKLVEEALSVEPESAELHYLKANSLQRVGDLKIAARSMRKALRLAQGRVSSLPMMLTAARLYDQLGQVALARSLRRELQEIDVTGRYAIRTLLDASKL